MRNEAGKYRPDLDNQNLSNFYLNLNHNFTNMLTGVISRTHQLMLSTFSYAQKIRMYGSNNVFDSLCRQYYNLSNTVQRLIGQINDNGIETNAIYNNLTRLSEIDTVDEGETFSEIMIINTLINCHEKLVIFINDNFNITSSKLSSEACSIIVERLNDHRHMIKELHRIKKELENTVVFSGQLN